MMTRQLTTIARPYAQAAFEFASEKKTVAAWDSFLTAAASITRDANMQQLLLDPRITSAALANVYEDILTGLDHEQKHFLQLLAKYNRLLALPEIAALFKAYCAAEERKMTVQVTSSVLLNDAYQRKLIDALSKRLQRHVTLECTVDPHLLGGAVITAGDLVIDGSIRSKLNRMIEFIS